jgi:hypothetical protein
MKRFTAALMFFCLMAGAASGNGLPWPAVAMDKLYLPFGLEFFMDGQAARDPLSSWGIPTCNEETCLWVKVLDDRTITFTQSYHAGTLTEFSLEYVLPRDAAGQYRQKIEKLKDSLADWFITYPQDPLRAVISPEIFFRAESKDTRLELRFHEREHTMVVAVSIQAK